MGSLFLFLGINVLIAVGTLASGSLTLSGACAAFTVGVAVYLGGGWGGFNLLLAYFVLATGATKFKYEVKAAKGLAQGGKKGQRTWKHVLANGFGPALFALAALRWPEVGMAGFLGAVATALSDTIGSELGQVYGKHPILLTTFKPVPPGTEGAVSVEGTLLGVIASAFLAVAGWGFGLVSLAGVGLVVLGAFIGTTAESYLGATIEGLPGIDNEVINALNTLIGGGVTALLISFLV